MVKLTKPVLFIFVGMITGLFSQFVYEIFYTFSIVAFIISAFVVFFSYLFLIAGKYNIKREKIIVTVIIVIVMIFNVVSLRFITKQSYMLYVKLHNEELMQISGILLNKDYNFRLSENEVKYDKNSISENELNKISEIAKKEKWNWIFTDSSKVGFQIKSRIALIYSEKPVNGVFYDSISNEYRFETSDLNGNWYIMYLPYWL